MESKPQTKKKETTMNPLTHFKKIRFLLLLIAIAFVALSALTAAPALATPNCGVITSNLLYPGMSFSKLRVPGKAIRKPSRSLPKPNRNSRRARTPRRWWLISTRSTAPKSPRLRTLDFLRRAMLRSGSRFRRRVDLRVAKHRRHGDRMNINKGFAIAQYLEERSPRTGL